ncbi:site-2 protease family protein [Luteolibacter soli]|uniref:Site-2 protease family protein n=1 Tax=Luteolibacter soli TaxID=3135280 RepID=A0ABU9AWQ9_9BACT
MVDPLAPTANRCGGCASEVATGLLACPGCGALVHAVELKSLAAEASSAATPLDALTRWRRALELLPANTRQHAAVRERIEALTREVDQGPVEVKPSERSTAPRKKGLAGVLVAIGAVLLKFKSLLILLLTKGKLLLLGLTKGSTFISMFAAFGVYWTMFGWKFAAGLVLSIYVHEMGHVWMLRKFGIQASAPMFIPGLGAVVRLKQQLPTAPEDARVGLAGPVWGFAAALVCWLFSIGFHSPLFAALAHVGAWINLFNLTPVWQLDGSRAFRSLTRVHRWIAVAGVAASFAFSREPWLLLILAVGAFRAFEKDVTEEPDTQALGEYLFLIVALSALTMVSANV